MGILDITLEQYEAMCRQEPRFAKWYVRALEQRERNRTKAANAGQKRENDKKARIEERWRAHRYARRPTRRG